MSNQALAAGRDAELRYFFFVVALMMSVFVFIGFAPTYYLRTAAEPPVIRPTLHLHGILYSAWMVLFIVQAALIGLRQPRIHRRLGYFGVGLAVAMLVAGAIVGFEATRASEDPFLIATFAFGDLIVFGPLVAAAVILRKQRDYHKRLMLCATVAIIDAGVGRWPIVVELFADDPRSVVGLTAMWLLTDIPLFAAIVFDLLRRSAIHAAYLWGGSFVVLSQVVKVLILQV